MITIGSAHRHTPAHATGLVHSLAPEKTCRSFLKIGMLAHLVLSCPQVNGQDMTIATHTLGTTATFQKSGEMANPTICRTSPSILSIETIEPSSGRHLWWLSTETLQLHPISPRTSGGDLTSTSDRELVWCPVERYGKTWFVFVSNGLEANDDIYLGNLSDHFYLRLTRNEEVDQHPQWSPDGASLVFVSGRTGGGDIYRIPHMVALIDIFEDISQSRQVDGKPLSILDDPVIEGKSLEEDQIRLTQSLDLDTYPVWAPNGRYVAYQGYAQLDGNREVDIFIIDLFDPQLKSINLTSTRSTDELQPSWSPDGQAIAFYTSNVQSGEDLPERVGLQAASLSFGSFCAPIWPPQTANTAIANDVRRNIYQGPQWGPRAQSLLFIKADGRKTELCMASFKNAAPSAETALLLVAQRTGLFQDRSLSATVSSSGTSIALVSFEGQEYHLRHAADQQGLLAWNPRSIVVPMQRKEGWLDRLFIGISELPVFDVERRSGRKTTWGIYPHVRQLFPTACIWGYPVKSGIQLGYGNIFQMPADTKKESYQFVEMQLQVGSEILTGRFSTDVFLLGGVGYTVGPEGTYRGLNTADRLLWPVGIGATIGQTTGKRIYFTAMAVMRFTNHPLRPSAASGDSRHTDSFLSIHLGFTFALSAMGGS